MRRITHFCGHEQEHCFIGEYAADYDRQALRLSRRKCDDCGTKALEIVTSEMLAAFAPFEPAALQGSPKQIAWADTIRAKRLLALHRRDREAAASIAQIADAKWWIDKRSDSDAVIIASAAAHSATA